MDMKDVSLVVWVLVALTVYGFLKSFVPSVFK
jgi:hypothetical protein